MEKNLEEKKKKKNGRDVDQQLRCQLAGQESSPIDKRAGWDTGRPAYVSSERRKESREGREEESREGREDE